MEDGVFHDTPTGTPQGGVISPLLLNIALHGMEAALGVRHNSQGTDHREAGSGAIRGRLRGVLRKPGRRPRREGPDPAAPGWPNGACLSPRRRPGSST